MTSSHLKDKLETLPKKPGCYQMLDKDGTIIYVGKAINLKNRVNSYFKGVHDYKTTKLVSNIRDFQYVVTSSEKEALILEYNLIKQFDPKYNIIFKDDKSYPYILLSDDEIPYCKTMRISKKSKYRGKIFGPYPDVTAANNTINLINKLFKTRKCKTLEKDVCLYYHLGQCPGYCRYDIDSETCAKIKSDIESFLKGDNASIINELRTKIDEAVEALEFEKAAEYRDLINDILYVTDNKQAVQANRKEDFDVFNYYVEDGYISIIGLFIRNGKLVNRDIHVEHLYGDGQEEFTSYLVQFYSNHLAPKLLVLDNDNDLELMAEVLAFKVEYFSRGYKHQMLYKAKENAMQQLLQNKQIIQKNDMYLEMIGAEFKKYLGFIPKRIELFDNSHIGGTLTCGGMVVYENLKANKKAYRTFRLDDSFDDLKSMHEMLYRRYFRVVTGESVAPDLIIVDGGRNQIAVAKKIIDDFGLDILVLGLGKDDSHNTAYLMDTNYDIIDIDAKSNIFLFLATMQDEVHRFVITFNRKLRKKQTYASKLDDIEGLGNKRRLALLRKYKTISNIAKQSIEELQTVLPEAVAVRVYEKLNGGEEDAREL